MANNPPFKARKRGDDSGPKATGLSTSMRQGGGYSNGKPTHSLSAQMRQPGGYSHSFDKDHPPTLGQLMGQRGHK